MSKPKVGIFGLTGCAGDQLVIINCEAELLDLVELIDIKSFIMAASAFDDVCELDVAFVEGAVVTEWDERTLHHIRERSGLLIALGTCAAFGGVAAAHTGADWRQMLQTVYGETLPEYQSSGARALHELVKVDAVITGCPIEKHEFLAAVANLLKGQLPVFAHYPVCAECKMHENECLLVTRAMFCCGPVTAAGCNARCPALGVACIGCRGPAVDANYPSAIELYLEKGYAGRDVTTRLGMFAPPMLTGANL